MDVLERKKSLAFIAVGGKRLLQRCMTSPGNFFAQVGQQAGQAKKINTISKMLRKSRSSFDLNFNFVGNQLGSVKELDDEEDLTIPYEPAEEPVKPTTEAEVEKTTGPDHELAVGISFELTEEDSVKDGSMDELKVLVERDSSPEHPS